VVHHIETGEMSLPHNDYYFRHKATVMAMNILLGMTDYIKEGNKQLEDFDLNSLNQCTSFDINGKYYSLPFIRNTEVLYFNAT
jgi:ABC-type glycerol-3-phosphate transport system substrate-binding protein